MKNDRPQFAVLEELVKWQTIVRRETLEKDISINTQIKVINKTIKKFNELANDSYKSSQLTKNNLKGLEAKIEAVDGKLLKMAGSIAVNKKQAAQKAESSETSSEEYDEPSEVEEADETKEKTANVEGEESAGQDSEKPESNSPSVK